MNHKVIKFLRCTFGTMLVGYIPGAPGTYGSALMIAVLWFMRSRIDNFFAPAWPASFWLAGMALTAISIWLSNDSEANFGEHDSGKIVIDECVGQYFTFFMIPLGFRTLLLGFLLFRLFDVVKPFPVYKLEEIEDGAGITLDDLAAGFFANISLHIIIGINSVIRAWL